MSNLRIGNQEVFNFSDIDYKFEEFMTLYDNRPIKNNEGGMSSTHMFWTWLAMKQLSPEYIIESGIFKGQGTWLLRNACPDAKIFSIDPDLDQREYIDRDVKYFSCDFSTVNWEKLIDPEKAVIFFDDHQNAYLRLQQMKWMGFRKALFEDNYPAGVGDCYSINKVLSDDFYVYNGMKSLKERIFRNILGIIENNSVFKTDAYKEYIFKNIEIYEVFPPLYLPSTTRWGTEWNTKGFEVDEPVLSDKMIKKFPVVAQEASEYTWICYVQLR